MSANSLGQPVGREVPNWQGSSAPTREIMLGSRCRLEPLQADRHAAGLHAAYAKDREGRNWTYLPYGPFGSLEAYRAWVVEMQRREDVIAFAIVDAADAQPLGVATYLRIDRQNGSIEVGHLNYAPRLQRTPMSTEAMYLMMRRVFVDWGYRRCEWKCHSLNTPSIDAAQRLGFRYEGTFFNHVVVKGRNRDTCWFSVLDSEWPALQSAFETWLDASNFDASGRQLTRLTSLMPAAAGVSRLS